ncbi:enoyl-CoA-hydratase DpgB [Saccharomonospora piscinae]|uniref:enoyl-CoA-hydratase DpgB n=1 Tax=Saccharomonospora piscinae TaxID=687388 RepID=UPI000466765D|nr:enoyl-CoA-hydratase DpgB [Saccharomonospora piscinae]
MSSSDEAAGTVVLDPAAHGPLTPELVRAVNEFCDRVEDASGGTIGIVRLDGEAGAADVDGGSWPGGDGGIRLVNRWERALRRMERLSAVTVAVLTGRCAGPSLDLVLATDYRIASTDTTLRLPTDSGQFWPGMALHRLATQTGVSRTRKLLLHSPELTAEESAELGLFDEIITDTDGALTRKTREFAGTEGLEFAVRRRLLLDAPTTTFDDALGVHLAACDRALRYTRQHEQPGSDSLTAFAGGTR